MLGPCKDKKKPKQNKKKIRTVLQGTLSFEEFITNLTTFFLNQIRNISGMWSILTSQKFYKYIYNITCHRKALSVMNPAFSNIVK